MKNFEELKEQWSKRTIETPIEGATTIVQRAQKIRKKQWIATVILGITCIVLIAFFLYVSAYKEQRFMIGLLSMILILVIRMGLEMWSMRFLKITNLSVAMLRFEERMLAFYKKRVGILLFITPLSMVIYVYGFSILLPYFKAEFSSGFYQYIVVSGIVSLLGLSWLIAKQVQKELRSLRVLRDELEEFHKK